MHAFCAKPKIITFSTVFIMSTLAWTKAYRIRNRKKDFMAVCRSFCCIIALHCNCRYILQVEKPSYLYGIMQIFSVRIIILKAKFHYASWFEAGSKLVADRFEPASVMEFGFYDSCANALHRTYLLDTEMGMIRDVHN